MYLITPVILVIIVILLVKVFRKKQHVNVALACMMRKPKNIEYWLDYHRERGIVKFYIRLEDTPELEQYLRQQQDVTLTAGKSSDISVFSSKEYDAQFSRQREFLQNTIKRCLQDNIKWIIHIDSDELIECDGKTIPDCLEKEVDRNGGNNIHTIIMDNYEAVYDKINTESDSCFTYKKLVKCKDGGCVSYSNGKGIGRVSANLQELGPHRFHYTQKKKYPTEFTSKHLRVLHFESCDFNSYISKFMNLANHINNANTNNTNKKYPFEFYNKSIEVAKSADCQDGLSSQCKQNFKKLYTQYKVVN